MAYFSNYTGFHNDEYHTRLIALEGAYSTLSTTANSITTSINSLQNSINSLNNKVFSKAYVGPDTGAAAMVSANSYLSFDRIVEDTNSTSYTYTNTYSIAAAPSASYEFELNENNYYESTNTDYRTASVERVTLNLERPCAVKIGFINYSFPGYNYGIFGKIDTTLSTTYTVDGTTSCELVCAGSTYHKATQQILIYSIPSGSHYIDIKYTKTANSSRNNDSLQFKILNVQPSYNFNDDGIFVVPVTGYYYITYTTKNAISAVATGYTTILYHLDIENNILEFNALGFVPGGESIANIYHATIGDKFIIGAGFSNKTIPDSTVTTLSGTARYTTGKNNNEFTIYKLG